MNVDNTIETFVCYHGTEILSVKNINFNVFWRNVKKLSQLRIRFFRGRHISSFFLPSFCFVTQKHES